MHDSLSDSVFGLVGSTVRLEGVLLLLVAGYRLELVGLLLEELVDLLLVFHDALGNDLAMLDYCAVVGVTQTVALSRALGEVAAISSTAGGSLVDLGQASGIWRSRSGVFLEV